MIFDELPDFKKDLKLRGLSMKTYDFHHPSVSSNLVEKVFIIVKSFENFY